MLQVGVMKANPTKGGIMRRADRCRDGRLRVKYGQGALWMFRERASPPRRAPCDPLRFVRAKRVPSVAVARPSEMAGVVVAMT